MFNELTLSHALYDISQEQLNEFISNVREFKVHNSIFDQIGIYSILDNYAVVLNLWLLLKEKTWGIHFNTDKIMTNSAAYSIFEQLTQNEKFHNYYLKIENDSKKQIAFAYFFSELLIVWINGVLHSSESMQIILENTKNKDYSSFRNSYKNMPINAHTDVMIQQELARNLENNIKSSNDFSKIIKEAILKSEDYTSNTI